MTKEIYPAGTQTKILCVECFKGKLIAEENNQAKCSHCQTTFVITGINQFKYK